MHGHNTTFPECFRYKFRPCTLSPKTTLAPEIPFCEIDCSDSGSDILVLRNDWQQQVRRMFAIAVDLVECRFTVADVPHHIICFRIGRNIDA